MRIPTAFGLVCVLFLYSSTAVDAKLPPLSEWPKLIEDIFKALDINNDLQVAEAEWEKFLTVADANKDGCLNLDEFLLISPVSDDVSKSIYKFWDELKENCVQIRKFDQLFAMMDRQDRTGNPGRPEMSDRTGNPGRPEMSDRTGNPGRPGISDRTGNPGRPEMSDRTGNPGRPEMSDLTGNPGRPGTSDRTGNPGRPEMSDRTGNPGRPEMSDRTGNPGRPGISDRTGNPGRPEMSDRTGNPGRPEISDRTSNPGSRPGMSGSQVARKENYCDKSKFPGTVATDQANQQSLDVGDGAVTKEEFIKSFDKMLTLISIMESLGQA